MTMSPIGQASASMPPKPVATPLPPLKRKKIGNICPKQANKTIKDCSVSDKPMSLAINTGKIALSPSPSSVANAADLLPNRSTLVVPGFLEPVVRGSGSLHSLQITIALEIEPNK